MEISVRKETEIKILKEEIVNYVLRDFSFNAKEIKWRTGADYSSDGKPSQYLVITVVEYDS